MSSEPAVIIGAIVSVIVAVAGVFDIVIDADALTIVLTALAPLVTGLLVRQKVSPVS